MTRFATIALAFALNMTLSAAVQAQTALPLQNPAPPKPIGALVPNALANASLLANPADVASVDAIIAALYDVISGPAGRARDWKRLHALFTPEARMVAVGPRPGGTFGARAMTVDDYIARTSKPFSEAGFFETELARTTETFGQVVHVFSTYEARHGAADAKPFARGVNSIQLFHDGARWWIVNLVWRAEDDKLALPERYLKSRQP